MMTTLLRKLWMNTMKLWKGTNNIAWLIEALLSSFLFFLFCCSPPFYPTHSSLPILLLLLFSLPFFLSFLLVLFLLLVVSLLALPLYYLMPSPSSTLTFLSPVFLSFMPVLFLLLFLSLLALTHDYLTPSPPLSLPPATFNSSPHPSPTAPSLFPFSPHPPLFSCQPFIFLYLLLLLRAFFLFFEPLKVTALLQDLPSPSWLKKKFFSEFSRLSIKSYN